MKRWITYGMLAIPLALALFGCAVPAPTATPTQPSVAAPTKAAPTPTKVAPTPTPKRDLGVFRFGAPSINLGLSPIWIAIQLGYIQEQGFLDVDWTAFGSGAKVQPALQSGAIEFGAGAVSGVLDATAAGKAEVILVVTTGEYSNDVVISKEIAQRLGITDQWSASQRIRALKGLRLGITAPGAGTDEITRFLLKSEGLDPDRDVELVVIGSGEAGIAALAQGAIDAYATSPPVPGISVSKGDAVFLLRLGRGDYPRLKGFPHLGFFAMRDFVEQNPEKTQAAVNAVLKAVKLIRDNPTAAKAAMRALMPELEQAVFDAEWDATLPALVAPDATPERVELLFMLKKAVWGDEPILRANELVASQFVERAKKEIGW
ncbi:MAG: ABC transporter substrate-binding protein [Chloroflexi bacterium]|nr:ABC transporter substrate-binding protein [Chloroflexota bacterium]